MVRKLLAPRWIFTTLGVILAVGVMLRLGFWQLERLEQRRQNNEQIRAQINNGPLDLNRALKEGAIKPEDTKNFEYRTVELSGQYRFTEEVILRNQVWENQPGYHLLTPLYLDGTSYVVLVDRGWIPLDQREPENWQQYREDGMVRVSGRVRLAQNRRTFGAPDPTLMPGQSRLEAWNAVNLERIAEQVAGNLLPVYVMASPIPQQTGLPWRSDAQPDLSEGSHLGYAVQWFSFAAVLAIGYPFFVRKQL